MDIYVGADISKGYADFCVMKPDADLLRKVRLDDTRQGHRQMTRLMNNWSEKVSEDEELLVGMEATGGMELNWLHLFYDLDEQLPADLTVYRLNPIVLRRFTEQRLHTNKTDPNSARAMADYLRSGLIHQHTPYRDEGPSDGLKTLARKTERLIRQSTQLKNELQALLQRAYPELIQYFRGHISQWVLRLIEKYPTPEKVTDAGQENLTEIPYITEQKAEELMEAASTSVASQTDEDTGLTMSLIAEDLLRLTQRVDRLKDRLWDRVCDRRAPNLLQSIGGIGQWAATVLYCEIGEITRFDDANSLVAYAGLDPQREYSGDTKREKSISKQGNSHIRSILYGCVTTALREGNNPPVRALYQRLKERGKHHCVAEVACMRKLLAIVYGCWSKNQWFDPAFEQRVKSRQTKEAAEPSSSRETPRTNNNLAAPVSRTEAKKRRKDVLPQKSVNSSIRGQDASP